MGDILKRPKRITYEQILGGWNWEVKEYHDERGWRYLKGGWERHYPDADDKVSEALEEENLNVSPAP